MCATARAADGPATPTHYAADDRGANAVEHQSTCGYQRKGPMGRRADDSRDASNRPALVPTPQPAPRAANPPAGPAWSRTVSARLIPLCSADPNRPVPPKNVPRAKLGDDPMTTGSIQASLRQGKKLKSGSGRGGGRDYEPNVGRCCDPRRLPGTRVRPSPAQRKPCREPTLGF